MSTETKYCSFDDPEIKANVIVAMRIAEGEFGTVEELGKLKTLKQKLESLGPLNNKRFKPEDRQRWAEKAWVIMTGVEEPTEDARFWTALPDILKGWLPNDEIEFNKYIEGHIIRIEKLPENFHKPRKCGAPNGNYQRSERKMYLREHPAYSLWVPGSSTPYLDSVRKSFAAKGNIPVIFGNTKSLNDITDIHEGREPIVVYRAHYDKENSGKIFCARIMECDDVKRIASIKPFPAPNGLVFAKNRRGELVANLTFSNNGTTGLLPADANNDDFLRCYILQDCDFMTAGQIQSLHRGELPLPGKVKGDVDTMATFEANSR